MQRAASVSRPVQLEREPAVRKRFARGVLVACGGCVFAWLLVRIGLEAVQSAFSLLSWRLVIVMIFPCVLIKVFDTLGWYFAFPADPAGFATLVRVRLIGQAVNSTTPTASIGGDAAKAWLLRDDVSVSEALSSLVISRTTMTAAQGLFLLIGVVVAQRAVTADSRIVLAMKWLLALELVAIAGFVAVQMRSPFSAGHGILRRFGVVDRRDVGGTLADIDRMLATFYRCRPGRLALSLAFHMLGWLASAAEAWCILALLGVPVSVPTALVIEAFGTGISFATFFVPSQVGFAEGGAIATFLALGLSGAAGLSFRLVRRVREALWIGVGLLLAWGYRTRGLAPDAAGT